MKVKEIKQASNDVLIVELCQLMYFETKCALTTQHRIAKELENRGVITSAEYLMKQIDY